MKRVVLALVALLGLFYPLAVYFGLEHLSPRWFAVFLALVWSARWLLSPKGSVNPWLAAAVLAFCALLGFAEHNSLLRWYPVLINTGLLCVFASSLLHGMPVIERIARLQEPDLPESGVRYTRRVTQVWVAFFLFNIAITASLALWAPLSWWTLYNGLIAYGLIGLLLAGEYLVRLRVRNHP